MGEIDREHLHKALGVHGAVAVVHLDRIGLQGRQSDKFFDVVQGCKANGHEKTSEEGSVLLPKSLVQ